METEEGAAIKSFDKKRLPMSVTLQLAFQSIGVVYGDLGTSPLYVLPGIFTDGIKENDDILGALSLIYYAITLIVLVKYILIVLRANDNGEGGTFAMYSLLCRNAKVGMIPNQQAEDANVSNYQLELPNNRRTKRASTIKNILENSPLTKFILLMISMLGTSMLIGDGILTPCITVLSAVEGIKQNHPSMTENKIALISIAILVFLFMVQRFGTAKVGYTFAPILSIWFLSIGGIGVYNFFKYEPTVIKALNPLYIIKYFINKKKDAWISLGGVVLCLTGTEALFADVGHFSVRSIQISTCSLVYPAIMLAYSGQASYLRQHNEDVADAFYKSLPHNLYWPMFVLAILAAIIASQSLISGTFSVIQQSLSLGCFPRVKVVHTSDKHEGQIYIPEINYLLMILCIIVTGVFKTSASISAAYGLAVVFVMTITSALLLLIMVMVWKTHIIFVLAYVVMIFSVELLFCSSVLYKFNQGGYLPLVLAAVLMTIMYVWSDVYRRKYYYEMEQKVPQERVKDIVENTNFCRIPGLAMFYSELVHGIPPIFKHYVANVPALHSVLVFVSIKSLPISKVPMEERFLVSQVEPIELNIFRCVARYGYTDVHNEKEEAFEKLLTEKLKDFIVEEAMVRQVDPGREIEAVEKALEVGVIHLVGEVEVVAKKGSNIAKRIVIDYAYSFLAKNLKQVDKIFDIPHERMVKVGMTYQL